MPRKIARPIAALVFLFALASTTLAESPYRVVWTNPMSGWNQTMPLGNGEVGVNAYFDGDAGRLHLLVARTDAWDELGRLVKLAEVCVGGFAPCAGDPNYAQTLDVERGLVTRRYGAENERTEIDLWVDVERDVVVVESRTDRPSAPNAFFYLWRDEDAGTIENAEVSDLFWGSKTPAQIRPDVVMTDPGAENRIAVYHRNVKTPYFDEVSKTQGLDDFPGRVDPLVDRTFGCVVSCEGAKRESGNRLVAPEGIANRFEIAAWTTPSAESPEQWRAEAIKLLDDAKSVSIESRRAARDKYWREFSDRSWVRFSPNESASATEEERAALANETFVVSQGYALQRFIMAAHGRGNYPIKFNGGLFTTAPLNGGAGRHDYRRWGPGYWFQNTRLSYYAMPQSGDFDLMKPFFDMYFGLLPLCEYRVKKYFGNDFEGAYYPECIYFWGDVFPETYGLVSWSAKDDPLQESRWHRWEWVGGLEIAFLALDYYDYVEDEAFLKEKAIPFSISILKFFDSFYKVDPETGKLKMSPSQACETWQDCDDAAPEIAGIRAVVARLLALSDDQLPESDRAFCEKLLAETPALPLLKDAETGETLLAPAARFDMRRNVENPELYSLFPFHLYGFDKPDLDLVQRTMEKRANKGFTGWDPDDVQYAALGDRENLRSYLSRRAAAKDPTMRFPAFWGPNYDWTPDQDHGGILCVAAERAVLQSYGDKIYVNPACPKEWNAEFKFRAPRNTTVEGKIADGKVVELKVDPSERAKDIVICE